MSENTNLPELEITVQAEGGAETPSSKSGRRTTKTQKGEQREKQPIRSMLLLIQQKLNAPKDICNRERNFFYRSTDGILEALKPLLMEAGCVLRFDDSIEVIAGSVVYIKSRAILENMDGESLEAVGFAREDFRDMYKSAAQQTGSATTYAHKLALNSLFAIDDAKVDPVPDPDCSKEEVKEPTTAESSPIPQTTQVDGLVSDGKARLTPRHPRWNKALSLAGKRANAGKSREEVRKEIEMTYLISDEDFEQLVHDAGI